MNASADGDEFVDKWRARWPEWRIGLVFVAPAERARVEAWFALRDELANAAWGGADATPGLAKLAWWQEELQGWAKGARRHPLATVLQRVDAPWQTLALALRLLPATREPSSDPARAVAQLQDLARAIDACEARLFAADGNVAGNGSGAVGLLAAKACLQGDAALAGFCLDAWPSVPGGTRLRRIDDAFVAGRLHALVRAGEPHPLSGVTLLWRTWRIARAG